MKFRTGLIIGLAVGYVLGAKAGTERYEQLKAAGAKLRSNEKVAKAADIAERSTRKPRAAVGNGLVNTAALVRDRTEGTA